MRVFLIDWRRDRCGGATVLASYVEDQKGVGFEFQNVVFREIEGMTAGPPDQDKNRCTI